MRAITSVLAIRLALTLCLTGNLWLLFAGGVRLQEGEFRLSETKFPVRGVGYRPLPIDAKPGDLIKSCIYARDLPLIAALGANTVRTYRLPAEADSTFQLVLESTGLYWLAGFPLEPYYNPSRSLSSRREEILADFRGFAERFHHQEHLIAFVVGEDVPSNYGAKFAGPVSEYYVLLGEMSAILHELDPDAAPLLAAAVSDIEDLKLDAAGVDFWVWDAGRARDLAESLQKIHQDSSRPVLIGGIGADAFDPEAGQEDEAAQASAALSAIEEVESASLSLGEVYAALADEYGNPARLGIFKAEATEQPGLNSLRPRALYRALAENWGGRLPDEFEDAPQLERLTHAATGEDAVAPGALVRVTGTELAADIFAANGVPWPLHQGDTCLCLDGRPVPLGMISPESMTAQIPWDVPPGEHEAVFFRAGTGTMPVKAKVEPYAPGIFPGSVLRAGTSCLASKDNGVRPGEVLELYGTGLGPGDPSLMMPKVYVNGVPAEVLDSGLEATAVGVNRVEIRVDLKTPFSYASSAYLVSDGAFSNVIPLSVVRQTDSYGITLRSLLPELVVQAGGLPSALEVAAEGVNGYCGPVEFELATAPEGLSLGGPEGFTGRTTRVEVSAAADAVPQNSAIVTLRGRAPDATGGDAKLNVTVLPSRGQIPVRAFSSGFKSGYPQARFDWSGKPVFSTGGGQPGRGINVLTVESATGVLSSVRSFDTWGNEGASDKLIQYLASLPNGTLVLFAVSDDGTLRLTSAARLAIQVLFGSRQIAFLGYQDSWALIGRKGSQLIAESASKTWGVSVYAILPFPMWRYYWNPIDPATPVP